MPKTTWKTLKHTLKFAHLTTCFSKISWEHAPDPLAVPPASWLNYQSRCVPYFHQWKVATLCIHVFKCSDIWCVIALFSDLQFVCNRFSVTDDLIVAGYDYLVGICATAEESPTKTAKIDTTLAAVIQINKSDKDHTRYISGSLQKAEIMSGS